MYFGKLDESSAGPVHRDPALEDGCYPDQPPSYSSAVNDHPVGEPPCAGSDPYQQSPISYSPPPTQDGRKPGKIPAAINAYWPSMLKRKLLLGETKETPLFCVRVTSGFSSKKPELSIYDGIDYEKDPMLAGTNSASMLGGKYDVTLPPIPGSGSDEPTKEQIKEEGLRKPVHKFSIEVGNLHNGELHREDFEWRTTRGDEVSELKASKFMSGFKLVRMSNESFHGKGGKRKERDPGTTSDGKEVVAVCASKVKLNEIFKFQFLGSGLTGELGDRFELMALITGINLWYQEVMEMLTQ